MDYLQTNGGGRTNAQTHAHTQKGGVVWRGAEWVDGGRRRGESTHCFFGLGGDREEVLLHVVVLDLADEGLGDDGGLVGESSSLEGGSVDVCGVVGEEFGVEVGGEGSVGDVGVLAEVGPGLEVLVVDVLSGLLQGFLLVFVVEVPMCTERNE